MSTPTPIPWSSHGVAVAGRAACADRCPVDRRRGSLKPWQALAAVIWDSQLLSVQHAVYRAAPRHAARLDELAHLHDEGRRKRP